MYFSGYVIIFSTPSANLHSCTYLLPDDQDRIIYCKRILFSYLNSSYLSLHLRSASTQKHSLMSLSTLYCSYIQYRVGEKMKSCIQFYPKLPLLTAPIHAGFPSPAADYLHDTLSLTNLLVTHPSATFLAWAEGNSMELVGIFDGDLLVVDRSLKPRQGDIVIASVDCQQEFTCKVFDLKNQLLCAASINDYPDISCIEGVLIEGVVAHSVRMHRPANYVKP